VNNEKDKQETKIGAGDGVGSVSVPTTLVCSVGSPRVFFETKSLAVKLAFIHANAINGMHGL
jgi:hypothetical protein